MEEKRSERRSFCGALREREKIPGPIARRLQEGTPTIADRHAEATILFADLVGFTALTGSMRPDEADGMVAPTFLAPFFPG